MNLRNRLLRRVKKHTSMTELFQGREPYPRQRTVRPAASSVIQARLDDTTPSPKEEQEVAPGLPVVKPMRVPQTEQMAHPAIDQQTKSEAPSSLGSASGVEPQPLQTVFRKHEASTVAKPAHVPATVPSTAELVEPITPPAIKEKEQPNLKDRVSQGMKRIFRKRQEPAQAKPVHIPAAVRSNTGSAELVVHHTENEREQPNLKDRVSQGMKRIFRKRQEPAEVNTSNALASEAFSATEAAGLTPPGPGRSGSPKPQDPDWQRLQAIFRKHQEKEEQNEADKANPPSLEPSGKNPVEPVRRPVEHVKHEPQSAAARKVIKNSLSHLSPGEHESSVKAKVDRNQIPRKAAEEMPEALKRAPITEQPPKQAWPLQSVWNVQRLDVPESRTHPAVTPHEVHDESLISYEAEQDDEPDTEIEPMVFGEEEEPLTEMDPLPSTVPSVSPRAPVEILPPSRPRPIRASVTPPATTLQRQPEDNGALRENKESPLVNTSIGPLPSDLWSLLGQTPPVNANSSAIHGTPPASFDQGRTAPDRHMPESKERSVPVAPVPAVVQRQTLPHEPSMPASSEQGQMAQNEKATQPEPNLDDLAQRVYSEIRHRLTLEWERMRRK